MMYLKMFKSALLLGLLLSITSAYSQTAPIVAPKKTMPIPELLINSTVKLESVGEMIKNGQAQMFSTTGTAFYYEFKVDSLNVPVLVTNFHVINNTALNKITFTTWESVTGLKRGKTIEFNNFQNNWIKHPTCDLAVLPLNPIMEEVKKQLQTNVMYIPFNDTIIPTDSTLKTLSAIEELLMIGYPKGFRDSKNNYPIVRKGTTATPLFSDFDGRNEFLLDIPIYEGSSGSPVILLNDGSFNLNGGLVAGTRVYLLGIATQSIDMKRQNALSESITDNPLNIAVVIKASALKDFQPIIRDLIKKQLKLIDEQKHKK